MSELFHTIYIQPKWLVCVVGIGAVILWGIVARLSRRDAAYYKTFRVLAATLFIVIIVGIIYRTLICRSGETERNILLIPFYSAAKQYMGEEYYRTLIMNIILFVPFGMSMPFLLGRGEQAGEVPIGSRVSAWVRKRPVLVTIITAAVLSFAIEISQFIFAVGNTEIDDLLMNTLGAAFGTLSYIICWKRVRCVKRDVND